MNSALFRTFLLMIMLVFCGSDLIAGKKKVLVSASESDANIYVDSRLMGNGQVEIVVITNGCVVVRVEKVGFLSMERVYCNKKGSPKPPKTDYFQLDVDDSYTASIQTDVANVDIGIETTKEELEAWKLLSQIITSYFDVLEITDRETGYVRTAWEVKSFKQNTIRTRVIVKLGSTNPLTYKVKLVSESSGRPQTSVKSDELFSEWGRVLRTYEDLMSELQSRLGS